MNLRAFIDVDDHLVYQDSRFSFHFSSCSSISKESCETIFSSAAENSFAVKQKTAEKQRRETRNCLIIFMLRFDGVFVNEVTLKIDL